MKNRVIITLNIDEQHEINVIEADSSQESLESLVTCIIYTLLGRLVYSAHANQGNSEETEFEGMNIIMNFNEETENGEIEISPPKDFGEALNNVLARGMQSVFTSLGLQVNYVEGCTFSSLDLVNIPDESNENAFNDEDQEPM